MLRRLIEQDRVVANERHLAIVEIAERDIAQVELPVEWIGLFLRLAVELPLLFIDYSLGVWQHLRARPRRLFGDEAQARLGRRDSRLKQSQAERVIVVAIVAVID